MPMICALVFLLCLNPSAARGHFLGLDVIVSLVGWAAGYVVAPISMSLFLTIPSGSFVGAMTVPLMSGLF